MVRSDDFHALARPELEAAVVEQRRRLDAGEARWLGMVAVVVAKRREDVAVAESTTSWLARACRLGYREAAGKVALARSLAAMPLTAAAVAAGDLSPFACPGVGQGVEGASRTVRRARSRPGGRGGGGHGAVGQTWVDGSGRHGADRATARARRGHLPRNPTSSGGEPNEHGIDGDAHPERTETIQAALEAADDGATDPADTRTAAQRRLDALVRVCRHYLDTADTATRNGARPHIGVILDLASLEGRAGRRCETDRYGVVHPEMARRLACDAAVSRIITDGGGQPLDVA